MSNIEQYLADILAARYGEEVRQSIHDAIQQCYEDGRAGAIDLEAREDIAAETTAREALDTRVNGIDTRVETLENDTTTAEEVTYDDTSTQLGATNVQGAIGALNNNLANCWKIAKTTGTVTLSVASGSNVTLNIPNPASLPVTVLFARSSDKTRTLAIVNMYSSNNNITVIFRNVGNAAYSNESMSLEVTYAYT